MKKHIKIYKEVLNELNVLQKQIAAEAGWSEVKMSRFLKGQDVKAGEFFELLSVMPVSFQHTFWKKFLDLELDDISLWSSDKTAAILYSIADRLQLKEFTNQLELESTT